MSQDSDAATRRIMQQLGAERRLPVFNVREGDVGVLFGFPLAGLFIGSLFGFEFLAIALLFVGLTLGVAIVYAAPPHLTAWDWMTDVVRFELFRPRVTLSYRADAEQPSTEGGAVEYLPVTINESTQELTNVERVWPGVHAVERSDGSMEAFVELRSSNMDFAMSDDWMAVQTAAEEFANNELDFQLTVYATTRSFPTGRLVDQLDDRLDDADVQANPVFGELIEEYRDERPEQLGDVEELHYYLGVTVERIDVHRRFGGELTPGERLTEFPIVGPLFQPFVTRRERLEEAELRHAMFEKLDARIETIQTDLVEKVGEWSSRRLSSTEMVVLLSEFWNGEEQPEIDADRLVRTSPAVGESQRRAEQ